MLEIRDTRFGVVEVDEGSLISFPNGIIGFPKEDKFVLLERGTKRLVGYLQSVNTPKLAFPVVDGELFGADYPQPSASELAESVGLDPEDVAVFIIVAANRLTKGLDANLLAPLIIDVKTRTGAQVVLDPRKYDANTSLAINQDGDQGGEPQEGSEQPEAPVQSESSEAKRSLLDLAARASKLVTAVSM